jgi:YegS/Rv2252/BmrU family lipid kinase
MPDKQVKLIVNPNADLGRAWRWAADLRPIVDEFGGADWAGTVYPTHATVLARQAAEAGYGKIIAVGGDGTAHEVINGLMQVPFEKRPQLGVVPLGSGNDFSHAIGMDPRSAYAMRQILQGQPRRIDVVKLVDGHGRCEYVDNTIGIGFDATVTIRSRNVPALRGFLIYLIAVLQTILLNHEAASMQVTSDRESWSEPMLMLTLCNGGREGGGFFVSPPARPDDGVLNYVGVKHVSRPMMLRLLPEVMRGTHGRFHQVRMGEFTRLELEADRPLFIHTDGEIFAGFGMDVRKLAAEVVPGAIEVLV